MTDASILEVPHCEKCGRALDVAHLDSSSNIKCICGCVWKYRPTKAIYPFLKLQCGQRCYDLKMLDSVVIGRDKEDRNYIKVTSRSSQESVCTYLRSIFVSEAHLEILLEDGYEQLLDSGVIVRKKKCSVKDLGSRNGTKLNTRMLEPQDSPAGLKSGDKIVLAPETPSPVTVTFEEKPE